MTAVDSKILENAPGAERRSMRDVSFALGILAILAILFVPIPSFLIDFGLALSIAFSILILMVALWIQKPLDLDTEVSGSYGLQPLLRRGSADRG